MNFHPKKSQKIKKIHLKQKHKQQDLIKLFLASKWIKIYSFSNIYPSPLYNLICFSLKQKPGYNEPQLWQTNLVGPELFVITEFYCIFIFTLISRFAAVALALKVGRQVEAIVIVAENASRENVPEVEIFLSLKL